MGKLLTVCLAVFILTACGTQEPTATPEQNGESNLPLTTMPPNLTVIVNGIEVNPVLGSYQWTYKAEDGSTAAVNASAPPPSELVASRTPVSVPSTADWELQFEQEPIDYKVEMWNGNDNGTTLPDGFTLEGMNGITIFNILAEWEHGKASYAFSLDVQFEAAESSLPIPEVTAGGQALDVTEGTHCWDGVCVDMVKQSPYDIPDAENAVEVTAGEEIRIAFNSEATPDTLNAELWTGRDQSVGIHVQDGKITAPATEGFYAVQLSVDWKQEGDALYTFGFRVDE